MTLINFIFKVQELFASVHQDLMVTHSFDAMTILAQLTPVVPTPIVKHKETELFVDAEKVNEIIKFCNIRMFGGYFHKEWLTPGCHSPVNTC